VAQLACGNAARRDTGAIVWQAETREGSGNAAGEPRNATAAADSARHDVEEKAQAEFVEFDTAQTSLSAERNKLAEAAAVERAALAERKAAEDRLEAALRGGVADPSAIQLLQKAVADAVSNMRNAKAASEKAVTTVVEAGAKADSALKALQEKAPSETRMWRQLADERDRVRGEELVARIYDHALVRGLSQERHKPFLFLREFHLPSYLPARVFSAALLDVIAPGAPPGSMSLTALRSTVSNLPKQLADPLEVFIDQAGDSMDRVRTNLERWFEDAMERVSGLYKRKTQLSILIIALGMTLWINADTLRIGRALASDGALREAVVAQAQALANNPGEDIRALLAELDSTPSQSSDTAARVSAADTVPGATGDSALPPISGASGSGQASSDTSLSARLRADSITAFRYRQIRAAIDSLQTLGIPFGWRGPCPPPEAGTAQAGAGPPTGKADCFRWSLDGETLPSRAIGLLITVLAVSLGAPFWFDMLNKVINIRAAGRAPEEKPKPPEAIPPATGAGR
jgi:hypothetical protein